MIGSSASSPHPSYEGLKEHARGHSKWMIYISAISALISLACVLCVVTLVLQSPAIFLPGPQDTMLCQPCRSSLDCQVSNAMIDPLNQILSLPRPNLMCLDNICSPSYLEGPIDICNQMETGREELLISVSRKMLATGQRSLRRMRRNGQGAHKAYFGKRILNNLHAHTGHNYLNVNSHDREDS